MTKQILSALFLLGFLFFATGCNTVRGMGEDLTASANFVQRKISGSCDDNSMPPSSPNPPQWPK